MVSSINFLSTSTISALFGPLRLEPTAAAATPANSSDKAVTGYTDDIFKAGDAIGNIIAIVAGMKDNKGARTDTAFSMEGAVKTDTWDGGYYLRKTGTGMSDAVVSDPWGLEDAKSRAQGSGAAAEEAKAYIKAVETNTIEQYDMGHFGVTSTMTVWERHDADDRQSSGGGSFSIKGMDQFYKDCIDMSSGAAIFKPTGQYAGVGQNGTVITLSLWGEKKDTGWPSA
ncbi:hypothetical protein [Agrobacterium pusense]|jgi:hypothetical protein|uniref:hypothetical protein n=1 Tax=Agrobacterium pusense TaxID=648995 RepID=UPI002452C218|nr:hypothetical protein [Agrobacterium pusense]